MRTLSARILLGFSALIITLGAFVATIVVNLFALYEKVSLDSGVMSLANISKDLTRTQDELRAYLDHGIFDATRQGEASITNPTNPTNPTINRLRTKRDDAIEEIIRTIDGLGGFDSSDDSDVARQFRVTAPKVTDLKRTIAGLASVYGSLVPAQLLHLPKALMGPNKTDAGYQAAYAALAPAQRAAYDVLQQLRDAERITSNTIGQLNEPWQRRAARTKDTVHEDGGTILMRVIYFGLAAVVIGIIITAWAAVMLRPLARLREGARRIAAGDYGERVSETGPAEIADLAREFNSMSRAVQDREQEKMRAARLAMVGKMAAQIAHEVRNPLSSISLNTELLGDELGDDAGEARELCRKIHAEVNRLTEVTETYLGLRGGQPKLAKESLNAIIGDLVGFVRNDLATRHVELSTALDPEDPTGFVDANQIRQCLINLVRNAADAVSANGGGSVVLRTRVERDRVEIAVEDDGIGIANDVLPRLFDPFFSTKKGGNGLGLALTQQIIRDHGGEIHVASRVGRGTTFTLSVPVG